jgi:adenine-specific DNA-methyltransferase
MQNLYNDLSKLLEKDERVFTEGKVLKNKVTELAIKLDSQLLKLLLKNKKIKEYFFVEAEGILVFGKDKFVKFVNNKEFLPNSFTVFKNKIGLVEGDEYLKDNGKVTLVWPYKDCVLEGGQEKEDVKRNEVFYNETLAPDEIDRLFEPKVLTNFKKIDKEGEHKVEQITEQDNLIIKGNNLLALHSLKKKFQGKVKLIYIDPPYNTGNDGFNYNDSFNHSTWLTFMKNRLEIAKTFLKDDGVIFVQADYNEAHYLKILLDEVFGRDKFINEIIWKRKFGNANETRRFATAFDNIYLYAKTENYHINLIKEKNSKHVQEYIKSRFTRKDSEGQHKGRLWMPYPLANPGKPTKSLLYEYKGYNSPPKGWRMTKESLVKLDNEERLYFPKDKSQRIQEKKFLDEYEGQPVDALWTDIFVINSQSNEAVDFDGQKPEDLLRRIILIGSNQNDLVMDYHLGSGTTAAVAHKLGRQYIGIEQLGYKQNGGVTRLKKVIAGEQNGISKAVGWKGGGSFVYMELKQWNEKYIRNIQEAKTVKDILIIFKKMKQEAFFRYEVDLSKFDKKQLSELPLEDQKRILIECLDKNHLYVNYSETEDTTYKIPLEEKRVNKQFYGI